MTVRLTSDGKRLIDVSQGSEQEKRKTVAKYIPQQQGVVTFLKSGKPVDSVYTTNVQSMVYERFCGYGRPDWSYTDKIIVDLGIHMGMELVYPQNAIYNPY